MLGKLEEFFFTYFVKMILIKPHQFTLFVYKKYNVTRAFFVKIL